MKNIISYSLGKIRFFNGDNGKHEKTIDIKCGIKLLHCLDSFLYFLHNKSYVQQYDIKEHKLLSKIKIDYDIITTYIDTELYLFDYDYIYAYDLKTLDLLDKKSCSLGSRISVRTFGDGDMLCAMQEDGSKSKNILTYKRKLTEYLEIELT